MYVVPECFCAQGQHLWWGKLSTAQKHLPPPQGTKVGEKSKLHLLIRSCPAAGLVCKRVFSGSMCYAIHPYLEGASFIYLLKGAKKNRT